MAEFLRDPGDWLRRLSPGEWIRAGLGELARAEQSYSSGDARAAVAACKRAAGMALNGALIVEPNPAWGRSYVAHLAALALDAGVPAAVREACRRVHQAQPPGQVVTLRSRAGDGRVVEAARDVIAHAYAVVMRHAGGQDPP